MKKYITAAAAVGALTVAAAATPAFAGNEVTTGGWLIPAANIKFCRTLDVKVTADKSGSPVTTVTVLNKDETSFSFNLGDSGALGVAEDALYHQLQIACDPDDRHEPYALFAAKVWDKSASAGGVPANFGGWVGNLPNRILEIKVK